MSLLSAPRKISDTTPASASTAVSAVTLYDMASFDSIVILADLVGATGGVLDVYLQSSWDGGTTWWDYAHFPQLASGASAVRYKVSPSLDNTIVTVGKGSVGTPAVALAANVCGGGHWGDQMRAVYVAGSSTSAGAAVTISVYGILSKR